MELRGLLILFLIMKGSNMVSKNLIFKKSYIIAEIGVNYYDIAKKERITPFDAAKLMIAKAKEGGADAVKFQSYKAETLASINSPSYWDTSKEPTKSQYELFKKFDKFGFEEYKKLSDYCNQLHIDFLSTPFDFESVDYLDNLVKYFKVASADITHHPLLKKIAEKNKPIFLSTGASTIKEIKEAIDVIKNVNSDLKIVLMHCVLSYPTKNSDANLKRIIHLKENFKGFEIGYSDHTPPDENMIILSTAYILGAKIIEKHFTLDKTLPGNDHYHAMDVEDLVNFRKNLLIIDELLSKDEKDYLQIEKISRKNARRSIVSKRNIGKGEILRREDFSFKRPGTGISPTEIDRVVGKKLFRNLQKDQILNWEDLGG
jgi:sialic acid synthase SpsE